VEALEFESVDRCDTEAAETEPGVVKVGGSVGEPKAWEVARHDA
jgi:hypothetical protein